MIVRVLAALNATDQSEVSDWLDRAKPEQVKAALRSSDHIRWVFDSSPSLNDIDLELSAYEEVYGYDPTLIVVDNLIDVADGDDEFSAGRKVMKELKFLARDTGAAVLVLHHTTEAHFVADGRAPARASILGKDTRLPALVLTCHTHSDGFMAVAVVKNRYGPADPSGGSPVFLSFDPAKMILKEV